MTTGEVHRVISIDEIRLACNFVVPIVATEDYVTGCHLAHSEYFRSWAVLTARIPLSEVVVADGEPGLGKTGERS